MQKRLNAVKDAVFFNPGSNKNHTKKTKAELEKFYRINETYALWVKKRVKEMTSKLTRAA